MSDAPDLCATLLDLLERQRAGDPSAHERISAIRSRLLVDYSPRDPSLTSEQAWGVKNLLDEWHDMFSFQPGRPEGLPLLLGLLRAVCRSSSFDTIDMYGREEWGKLVDLRGPVERVLIRECAGCHRRYPAMGTSGFVDIVGLVCGTCGFVVFRSSWSEVREAPCPCGGVAVFDCPSCGSAQGRIVEEMSPYRYFLDHAFHREEGA